MRASRRRPASRSTTSALLCPLDAFAATVRAFATARRARLQRDVPFKFEAWALAGRRSERARIAGACNMLRFEAEGWFGDNTDGAGLVRDIERNAGVELRGARVLLLGAGGAAAGALGPLLASGAREVVVANRSVARAEALVARHLHEFGDVVGAHVAAAPLDACGRRSTSSSTPRASSVSGAPVPVAGSVLKRGALALDMMYGAAAGPFLAWAAEHGTRGRDGLGMLVEQAAEAFLLWRGVAPKTAPVLRALRARLEAQ